MLDKPSFGKQLNHGHPLAQGLVACYLMNEGCGDRIYDLSGNGNIGSGSGIIWIPAEVGCGTGFEGANNISISSLYLPNMTLIVSARNTGSGRQSVVELNSGGVVWMLAFSQDNKIAITPGGAWGAGRQTTTTYNDGLWHQITAIGDPIRANMRVYVDGMRKDAQNTSDNYAGAQNRLGGHLGYYFTGEIEYTMLYNRALTPAEIQWLYQEPFAMFDQRRLWAVAAVGHVPHFLLLRRAS